MIDPFSNLPVSNFAANMSSELIHGLPV